MLESRTPGFTQAVGSSCNQASHPLVLLDQHRDFLPGPGRFPNRHRSPPHFYRGMQRRGGGFRVKKDQNLQIPDIRVSCFYSIYNYHSYKIQHEKSKCWMLFRPCPSPPCSEISVSWRFALGDCLFWVSNRAASSKCSHLQRAGLKNQLPWASQWPSTPLTPSREYPLTTWGARIQEWSKFSTRPRASFSFC